MRDRGRSIHGHEVFVLGSESSRVSPIPLDFGHDEIKAGGPFIESQPSGEKESVMSCRRAINLGPLIDRGSLDRANPPRISPHPAGCCFTKVCVSTAGSNRNGETCRLPRIRRAMAIVSQDKAP